MTSPVPAASIVNAEVRDGELLRAHGDPRESHIVEGVGARAVEQWRAHGVGVQPPFPELERGRGGGVAVDEVVGECGRLDL
jgi:hypothetical protein